MLVEQKHRMRRKCQHRFLQPKGFGLLRHRMDKGSVPLVQTVEISDGHRRGTLCPETIIGNMLLVFLLLQHTHGLHRFFGDPVQPHQLAGGRVPRH